MFGRRTLRRAVVELLYDRGLVVYRKSRLPWGTSAWVDIERIASAHGQSVNTVIDVGANTGQAADSILQHFPAATVHSFEPHPITFLELKASRQSSRHKVYNEALGEKPGDANLYVYDEQSVINSLVDNAQYATRYNKKAREVRVQVNTLDIFCRTNGIHQIDLMKVDTEGFDLAVLRGSEEMLAKGAIKFVYVEFNSIRPQPHTHGGALVELDDLLAGYSYKFIASYIDHILTDRDDTFTVANALYLSNRAAA